MKEGEIINIEERLNEILKNLEKGVFNLEDASFFKSRSSLDIEEVHKIWIEYIRKILGPLYSSLYSFAIIGILGEEQKPLSRRELVNRVQRLFNKKLDKYERFEFNTLLDILTSPAATRPLIKKEGVIFKKYTLTDEGKIAYVLLKDSIEGILKRGKESIKILTYFYS